MLRIAICDDEKKCRNDLKYTLKIQLELKGISYTIDEFSCGEDLLNSYNTTSTTNSIYHDLIFLDIEMGSLNGMETAKGIRKLTLTPMIIFVTSHPDFVFHGYEVQAFHYILKPYEEDKIIQTLNNALLKLDHHPEQFFIVEQKSGVTKVPFQNIYYFLSDKRLLSAVTAQGDYTFYGKLNDLTSQLPDAFIRIHNRYIVNLSFVESIQGNNILCNGTLLPISRSFKQDFHIAFTKFMLN